MLFIFFRCGNKFCMNKKEYIAKIEELIFNKIKYHAPNLNSLNIDFDLLEVVGIETYLPVFIYKKPLDKIFFEAFKRAKKRTDFNLILTKQPIVSERKLKSLANCKVILPEEMGSALYYSLDALNINYPASSTYQTCYNSQFLAINGKKIELEFTPFYLHKKYCENHVVIDIKNYLCNGQNFYITLSNIEKTCQKVSVEMHLPLPRGYYFFKKDKDCIEIQNLQSKTKAFFNFFSKGARFSFANVDGLEFSSFACVNFECEISLLPKEQKRIYFNYGDKKYCLKNAVEMNEFFNISQQKMFETFDVKIKTKDNKFDDTFNRYLPEKIWRSWQKNVHDEESENAYLKIKNSIIKKYKQGEQIDENFRGLKQLSLYRNQRWKRVFIVRNGARYMFADNTRYFNFTLLTNEIFKKNNEIYLSFDK